MLKYSFDGFCRRDAAPEKMYHFKGMIQETNGGATWDATVTLDGGFKGNINGTITGLYEEGPIRRAVEIAAKSYIQDLIGIDE